MDSSCFPTPLRRRFGVLLASFVGLVFGLAAVAEIRAPTTRLEGLLPIGLDGSTPGHGIGPFEVLVEALRTTAPDGLLPRPIPGYDDEPAFTLSSSSAPCFTHAPWAPPRQRLHADGKPIPEGPLLLRHTFPARS